MHDIYKNFEEFKAIKKRKILIAFYNMIVDILSNKKPNEIVTELFIRGRILNISFDFIAQSHFAVPRNIRLNSTLFYYENSKQKRISKSRI